MDLVKLEKGTILSSKRITEKTGKEHSHVLRDIRSMMSQLKDSDYKVVKNDITGLTLEILISKEMYDLILHKYEGLSRVPMRLQEESALKTIEQLLGTPLIRQFKVGKYRIDGYDAVNNIAYEIDEPQHNSVKNIIADQIREDEIKKKINCKFRRISL